MDVDLAFLPPASLLHPVATPVVALACPGPQVLPADPPTPSAGPRSTAVNTSIPASPSPSLDTQTSTSGVVHTDGTPVVRVVESLDQVEVSVPVLSPVVPESSIGGVALRRTCRAMAGQHSNIHHLPQTAGQMGVCPSGPVSSPVGAALQTEGSNGAANRPIVGTPTENVGVDCGETQGQSPL